MTQLIPAISKVLPYCMGGMFQVENIYSSDLTLTDCRLIFLSSSQANVRERAGDDDAADPRHLQGAALLHGGHVPGGEHLQLRLNSNRLSSYLSLLLTGQRT